MSAIEYAELAAAAPSWAAGSRPAAASAAERPSWAERLARWLERREPARSASFRLSRSA